MDKALVLVIMLFPFGRIKGVIADTVKHVSPSLLFCPMARLNL